jgi:cell wall-associated NlpC family hydrolase
VVLATPGSALGRTVTTVQRGYVGSASVAIATDGLSGPVVPATVLARITHSALTVDKTSVVRGQSIVLTGRLTVGAAGLPLANHAARLESSAGGAWKTVGTALADAAGAVTFTVKPTASAKYRLAFGGIPALASSVSTEQSVTVRAPAAPSGTGSSGAGPSGSGSSGSTGGSASASGIGANGQAGSATALAFLDAARVHAGKQYVYGTAGPNTFDCSGLVKYVAAQFGLSLPHNAHAQMSYGTPVAVADAAPGDLIFFLDGGHAYHVGIYAGGNQMFDAPNSRKLVGQRTIWGSNVVVRRIF